MSEQGNKVKPVNPEKGWQLRTGYEDEVGNIFNHGKFVGHKDDIAMESEKPEMEEDPKLQSQDKQELKQNISDDDIKQMLELTQRQLEQLKAEMDRTRSENEQFKRSLQSQNQTSDPVHLAKELEKARQFQSGGKFYSNVQDIDPDDYIKDGVAFTSYGSGYVIIDDVRHGIPVRTPYGRIFRFNFTASRITQVGRDTHYSSFCTFVTHSKKEVEWLQKHSKFNVEFFMDAKISLSADVYKIKIASQVEKEISKLETPDILARARQHGIKIGGDLSDIKAMLIKHEVDRRIKAADEQLKARVREGIEVANKETNAPIT